MSSLDFLDAPSQAQLQSYIQNALRDGLLQNEQRLAQSEAAREQQAAQLQELHQTIQQLQATAAARRHAAPTSSHEDFVRRNVFTVP
ncbi:hypothetical protein E4U14_005225 [Claviceps sp. LM454 group G7]|nr:hypothetical protein E4U14_005225 [Claviceps sp. LM454 group G7]